MRKATLTQLEGECEKQATQKCQTVTLYEGGQYWLYKYKRYTDVRIVFAPEASIAAFGGDPDNFQFPRWCLDMGVLRAYEDGKPAKTPNFLKFNFAGPAAGEAVFVSGHPGATDRAADAGAARTAAQPRAAAVAAALLGDSRPLIQFASQSPQNERITADLLNSLENAIKVRRKMLDALHEDSLLARKAAEEATLRSRSPRTRSSRRAPVIRGATSRRHWPSSARLYEPYVYHRKPAPDSRAASSTFARTLVRGAAERDKPNGAAIPRIHRPALPRIEQQLGATVPVYPELEEIRLDNSLERMREWLGPDHPVVRKLLSKESPAALAKRLVAETKLADPAVRLELWKGGSAAIAASTDPMIVLARSVDADARAVRKAYEDGVEAPVRSATERIAQGALRHARHQRVSRTPRSRCASTTARCRAGMRTASRSSRSRGCHAPSSAPPAPIRSAFRKAGSV